MSGFNYLINLTVVNGGAFGKLAAMAGGFESKLDAVQGEIGQTQKRLDNLGSRGRGVFDGLKSSVAGWVAGLGIAAATLGSLQTAAQNQNIENAIVFSSGSTQEGVKNLEYVRDTADKLGLSLQPSLEGFKTLSGSLMGTGLAGDQARDIFHGVASAAGAMGMSAEDSKGAFIALGQMASKGKVQAEELRGQLGERLSGAFYQAAASMGLTTTEFDKMLETGKVFAKDFLPGFAAQLERTFGDQAMQNSNSATASFNRMSTAIYNLKVTVGTQLMPTVTALINNVFVPMVTWIGRNIDVIGGLVTVFGSLYLAAKTYTIITGIMSLVTGGFTGTMWGLNAALWANPITWIIGAFVALTAAIVYAWNKSEGFRGFLFAMWETIKAFGSMIIDRFVKPVIGAFQILKGAWNGSTDEIQAGMNTMGESMNSWSKNMGDEMGKAFDSGWNNGVADFRGNDTSANKLAPSTTGLGGANFGNGNPVGDKNKDKAKEVSTGITGGGQRNITINVSKLTGVETLHTVNLKEGADRVGEELLKKMLQVINGYNQLQNG